MKVYIADVDCLADPNAYRAAYEKADRERQKKADRFRFPADKRLCLGAGLLLQEALRREGVRDGDIGIQPGGKPYLKGTKECFFNLSHAGTKVLCALAGEPVGCDIEKKKTPPLEVARRVFSPQEQERLFHLEGEEQKQYFYRLWTGKESFVKMTGEGLWHVPDDFTIRMPFGSQIVGEREVTFYEVLSTREYQGTVCKAGTALKDREESGRTIHREAVTVEFV